MPSAYQVSWAVSDTAARPRRWPGRVSAAMRRLCGPLCGAYGLALALYLALRTVFGDGFWWLALLNMVAPFLFLPLLLALPLAAALRTRRALLLLAALAVIAALWFGPYWLPKNVTATGGPTLRVVSLNVWSETNRSMIGRIWDWVRSSDADLVLLQEVHPIKYLDQALLVAALRDIYPYQVLEGAAWDRQNNLVLSRYPILAAEAAATIPVEVDGPRFQRLTLDFDGQPVVVYNAHLLLPFTGSDQAETDAPASLIQWVLSYDDRARNGQITQLLALVEAETLPVMVAGDFNLPDQSAAYGLLADRLTDSFRAAGVGMGFDWPVAEALPALLPGWMPPLLRIDYIWHSAHFRALEAGQGPPLGSDHLPQYAVLELLPTDPPAAAP